MLEALRSNNLQRLDAAQSVLVDSTLHRRRVAALYVLITLEGQLEAYLITSIFSIILLVILVFGSGATRTGSSRTRASSLTAPTQANQLDRFAISHTVRDGDTIWALSVLYYGSYSMDHEKSLRMANPWLPDDPRQLKIGLVVKIPLI
jgi:hypothetical protein